MSPELIKEWSIAIVTVIGLISTILASFPGIWQTLRKRKYVQAWEQSEKSLLALIALIEELPDNDSDGEGARLKRWLKENARYVGHALDTEGPYMKQAVAEITALLARYDEEYPPGDANIHLKTIRAVKEIQAARCAAMKPKVGLRPPKTLLVALIAPLMAGVLLVGCSFNKNQEGYGFGAFTNQHERDNSQMTQTTFFGVMIGTNPQTSLPEFKAGYGRHMFVSVPAWIPADAKEPTLSATTQVGSNDDIDVRETFGVGTFAKEGDATASNQPDNVP